MAAREDPRRAQRRHPSRPPAERADALTGGRVLDRRRLWGNHPFCAHRDASDERSAARQLTSADSARYTSKDKPQSVVTSPRENEPGPGKCNTTERERSSMKAVVKIAAKACE